MYALLVLVCLWKALHQGIAYPCPPPHSGWGSWPIHRTLSQKHFPQGKIPSGAIIVSQILGTAPFWGASDPPIPLTRGGTSLSDSLPSTHT